MGDKREGWHEKTFVSHVFARIARHQLKISKPELLPLSWNRTAFFLAIHFQKENKPCIWGWFVHWKNYWLIKGIMHSLNTTLLAQYTKDFRKHWINKNPISVIYSIVTKKVYLFFLFLLVVKREVCFSFLWQDTIINLKWCSSELMYMFIWTGSTGSSSLF